MDKETDDAAERLAIRRLIESAPPLTPEAIRKLVKLLDPPVEDGQ